MCYVFRTRNEDSKRFVRRNNEQDFRKNKENLKQNEPTNRNFQNRRHDHGNRRNDRDTHENDNHRRNYQNSHNRNGKTNENVSNKKDDFRSKNSHPPNEYDHVIKNLEIHNTTDDASDQLASEKLNQLQISDEKILKKKTEIKNTENFNTALYEKFRKKALTRDLSQTLDDVDVSRMKNLSLNQEAVTGPESQYKFSQIPFTYDSNSVPPNEIGSESVERSEINYGSNPLSQFSSTNTNSYQSPQGRNMMRNVNSDLNYQLGANIVPTMPQMNSVSADHFATSENSLLQQLAMRNVPNEQLGYKNMRTHIPVDNYNIPIMENPNSQILNTPFNGGARNASVESAPLSRFPYENMGPTPRNQLENGNYRGDSSQFMSSNVPTQQIRNLPNTPTSQYNSRGVTNFNAMQDFNVEDLTYQLKDGNALFMQPNAPNDNVAVSQLRSGFRNINNVPPAEFNNVFYQQSSSNKRMTPTPGNSFMEGNPQSQFDMESFPSYQQMAFDMNSGNLRNMSRADMAAADMPVSQFDFVRYPPPTIMSENAMNSRKLSPNLSSSQMMPLMSSGSNVPLSYNERPANRMPMRKERLPDEFSSAENPSNSSWLMVNLDSMPLLTDESLQRPFPTDSRSPFPTQHTENTNMYMPSQSSQKVTLPPNPMQQQFSNPNMLVRPLLPKNGRQFNSENIPMQHIPQTQNTFSNNRGGGAFPEFIPNNSQFSQNMPGNDFGADMMAHFYDAASGPAEPELRGVNQFFDEQVQFNNGVQDSMTINVKDDCIYEQSPVSF